MNPAQLQGRDHLKTSDCRTLKCPQRNVAAATLAQIVGVFFLQIFFQGRMLSFRSALESAG
jgi:hypothetical protein